MKGNARMNGAERTRTRVPTTRHGKATDRPETKREARLRRRTKQYELYATGPVAEKRKTEGSYTETHRPGSLSK